MTKKRAAPKAGQAEDSKDEQPGDFPELIADSADYAGPERRGAGRPLMFTESEIAGALRVANGFTSQAAANLKCCHDTIDRAIKRWPGLAQIQRECRHAQIDTAEGELQKAIATGNMTAIIFFLKCQAKGRGYVERIETTGPDGGPIRSETEVTGQIDHVASGVFGLAAVESDKLDEILAQALGESAKPAVTSKPRRPK